MCKECVRIIIITFRIVGAVKKGDGIGVHFGCCSNFV